MKTPTLSKLPDRISKRGRVNEGRPTDYRAEFCERAIELGKLGWSFCMMACEFDIAEKNFYEWIQKYPEFRQATTRARHEAQSFFERKGIENLGNRDFNPKLWEIQVRCRFPETYRDTVRTELTGANGGAIKVQEMPVVSDAELLKLADPSKFKN